MKTNFKYQPTLEMERAVVLPLKVAVSRYLDKRGARVKGAPLLLSFPLVPFAAFSYDRPEGGMHWFRPSYFEFRPPTDFAMALVHDLKRSGNFKEVVYSERRNPGDADILIVGVIHSTRFHATASAYLVGEAVALVLWLAGLPGAMVTNEVVLTLRCERADGEDLIWEKTYSLRSRRLIGIYSRQDKFTLGYPSMLEEIHRDAISDIVRALSSREVLVRPGRQR